MYNFKQLTATSKFLSYKDWDIGNYVVGTITNMKENNKNPKVQDVVVSVLDTNISKDKVNLIKGDVFTINGTTALEKALSNNNVEEGDIIKVVYLGKEIVKTGPWKGTQANKLDVFIAAAQDVSKFSKPESDDSDELV